MGQDVELSSIVAEDDQFLGEATSRPFDPLRIFRWRNYRDYGTGVSGDLFVHLFSSLHFVVSSKGPRTIMAQGGLRYWKDGREVPDVLLGMFDYPEADGHPPFNLSLRVNFVDGTSGSTFLRLVGSEGAMDVTWTEVVLRRNKVVSPTDVFLQMKTDEMGEAVEARAEMLPPAESVYVAEDDLGADDRVGTDPNAGAQLRRRVHYGRGMNQVAHRPSRSYLSTSAEAIVASAATWPSTRATPFSAMVESAAMPWAAQAA